MTHSAIDYFLSLQKTLDSNYVKLCQILANLLFSLPLSPLRDGWDTTDFVSSPPTLLPSSSTLIHILCLVRVIFSRIGNIFCCPFRVSLSVTRTRPYSWSDALGLGDYLLFFVVGLHPSLRVII